MVPIFHLSPEVFFTTSIKSLCTSFISWGLLSISILLTGQSIKLSSGNTDKIALAALGISIPSNLTNLFANDEEGKFASAKTSVSPCPIERKALNNLGLKIGSISIKRNKVTKDNLGFFQDISKIIKDSDRPLIIFPQGTRVLPDERPPFKKGASRIYEELKISCQPVAINSGYVWPKKGKKNINQTITISILEPIIAGYPKEEFIKILENNIYKELDLLN